MNVPFSPFYMPFFAGKAQLLQPFGKRDKVFWQVAKGLLAKGTRPYGKWQKAGKVWFCGWGTTAWPHDK